MISVNVMTQRGQKSVSCDGTWCTCDGDSKLNRFVSPAGGEKPEKISVHKSYCDSKENINCGAHSSFSPPALLAGMFLNPFRIWLVKHLDANAGIAVVLWLIESA